jgi:hypothetical protein
MKQQLPLNTNRTLKVNKEEKYNKAMTKELHLPLLNTTNPEYAT